MARVRCLIVVTLVALAGVVHAERPERPGRGGPPLERILTRHADRLELDEETREAIAAVGREAREERETLRSELRREHRALRELLALDRPDEAAVLAQAERIGAVETRLQQERLRTMLAVRGLLSAEQREELVGIHEERRAERRHRRPGRDAIADP